MLAGRRNRNTQPYKLHTTMRTIISHTRGSLPLVPARTSSRATISGTVEQPPWTKPQLPHNELYIVRKPLKSITTHLRRPIHGRETETESPLQSRLAPPDHHLTKLASLSTSLITWFAEFPSIAKQVTSWHFRFPLLPNTLRLWNFSCDAN